jgi:hypothetical protein
MEKILNPSEAFLLKKLFLRAAQAYLVRKRNLAILTAVFLLLPLSSCAANEGDTEQDFSALNIELIQAVEAGDLTSTKALLARGADANYAPPDGSDDSIGFLTSNGKLNISYGNGDNILISSGAIERYEREDGGYLTDSDVNYIIQQVTAFSKDKGVSFSTADDVRKNEELAQWIAAQWHND